MKILKMWLLWSMITMAGVLYAGSVQAEQVEQTAKQETASEPLKAEVIAEPKSEPIEAEVIAEPEEPEARLPEKPEAKVEESYVVEIDDDEIESCDHEYTRVHGAGGEEGDVWEYTCGKCGYTYYEPHYEHEDCPLIDDDIERGRLDDE